MAEQTVTVAKSTNGTTMRRWEPTDMFEAIHQEMERFWPRWFPFPFSPSTAMLQVPTRMGLAYWPKMDVFEKDKALVFKVELPGLTREDVHVEIDDGYLVIKGESKAEKEMKEGTYYRMERAYGSFYRRTALPFEVTPEQVTATMKDGVLEVLVPRPAETSKTQTTTSIPVA